jgi:pimeloyl-ACP methyl ester carboxylesterase
MDFKAFGNIGSPTLLLIPGLGVSYEIFLPLICMLENRFHIIAVQVDGFTLGQNTEFTSIDDQARQVSKYIQENLGGHIDIAYGLSLGGKILSRILERNEVEIEHSILDAAPLLSLPRWLVCPLKYLQCANVWSCYHWTGFWRWVFHSHYFDVLLDECRKVFLYGGTKAVLDGYKSVYTTRLESVPQVDIHFWYGTKEAFVAKAQIKHLKSLCPNAQIKVFKNMNHGQLLIDRPEEIASLIERIEYDNQ